MSIALGDVVTKKALRASHNWELEEARNLIFEEMKFRAGLTLTKEEKSELENPLNKVKVIKMFRERTGCSLAQSIDIVKRYL